MHRDTIISAVIDAKCPMLSDMNLKTAKKKEIITRLKESCCPVLEELSGAI